MKNLKEMKAVMSASEMNHIRGGEDVQLSGDIDPEILEAIGAGKYKTVSADCNYSGTSCHTWNGFWNQIAVWAWEFGPGPK